MAKASLVLQSSGRAIPPHPYDKELEAFDSIEQERIVESFAKENGFWIPEPHDHYRQLSFRFYGYGGEAQVYIEEEDQYVHKICRISQYDSLLHFIDRIAIENLICPAAFLTVEGFPEIAKTTSYFFSNKDSFVKKNPWSKKKFHNT